MIDLKYVAKVWASDRYKDVMLPGLGSKTCGEIAAALPEQISGEPTVAGIPTSNHTDEFTAAREILTYLGYSQDVSMEPTADYRRDRVAEIIIKHTLGLHISNNSMTGLTGGRK